MRKNAKPDFRNMDREEVESLADAGNCHAKLEFYLRCAKQKRLQDLGKAVVFLSHAARSGLAEAEFELGSLLCSTAVMPSHYHDARHWYLLAIKHGHVEAKIHLGVLYLDKKTPLSLRNWTSGLRLLQEAADVGLADAQYNLGAVYVFGDHPDYEKGRYYLMLAAKQGVALAYVGLGCVFRDGLGVDKDIEQSARHYYAASLLSG